MDHHGAVVDEQGVQLERVPGPVRAEDEDSFAVVIGSSSETWSRWVMACRMSSSVTLCLRAVCSIHTRGSSDIHLVYYER